MTLKVELEVIFNGYDKQLDRQIRRAVGYAPCAFTYDFRSQYRHVKFPPQDPDVAEAAGKRAKQLHSYLKPVYVNLCYGSDTYENERCATATPTTTDQGHHQRGEDERSSSG